MACQGSIKERHVVSTKFEVDQGCDEMFALGKDLKGETHRICSMVCKWKIIDYPGKK